MPRDSVVSLAALVAAAAFCASLAGGYFLSDDFVQLANFGHWDANGRLWSEVAAKFSASIDGVNGFWRPLTYATYAANYAVNGADARGWLAVNLALHLANAVLVGALVERLCATASLSRRAAAIFAAVFFFALASGWEAVLWIACRYDTLSTFFVLLGAWWFAGGSRGKAVVAAALALMSKESGAVALVLIGFLAVAHPPVPPAGLAGTAKRLVARLWPFLLLGVAYVALRAALFGNPFNAYVGVSLDPLSPQYWTGLHRSGLEWGRANFPGPAGLRMLALVGSLALLGAGLVLAGRAGAVPRRYVLAVLATLGATLVLVIPFLPAFDPSGLGGRLFYLPGALLAIALGLAAQACLAAASGRTSNAAVAGAVLATLILLNLHWMWRGTREYQAMQREMRAVVAGIAEIAATQPRPPALLVVPDTLGRAAFGRNAQAGLVLPPVQRAPLSARVLVQLDTEIASIPTKVSAGLFDWLQRHSLFELADSRALPRGARAMDPSVHLCWSAGEHRFKRMDLGEGPASASRLETAYAAAGCRSAHGFRR